MVKLILSTSNLINGASSIFRRPTSEKSNVEFINGLRSNLLASKEDAVPAAHGDYQSPRPEATRSKHLPSWVASTEDSIYVPAIDHAQLGLSEARAKYEITVKLFFLHNASASNRRGQTREAIALVLKQLRMPSVDLLIISFPGISYDKSNTGCTDAVFGATQDDAPTEPLENMVATWRSVEELQKEGLALKLGIAEFCEEKLQALLPYVEVRPAVDQINLKDICLAPRTLLDYTKRESIEVWTHSDCTNILPSGTLRELLGTGEKGAGLVLGPGDAATGLKGNIRPQWVIKYTAIVRDRGVIEDKGYFAMAQIDD